MAMDLVTVPEAEWFEFDQLYSAEMVERRRLLQTVHDQVFAACPISGPARGEALGQIVAALTSHHPDWFTRDGPLLHNRLTGESWPMVAETGQRAPGQGQPVGDTDASVLDPLELAGRLVQEDLCIIQNGADGPMFTAGLVCFPSRWRLAEKIGKPLSAVHGPVPLYADRLAKAVDRFMRHLKAGPIACRLNWSVLDDPTLFQPTGKWRRSGSTGITPDNAGSRAYLRVERQTLRRLPASGAVLFGIRVHCYELDRVIDRPSRAAELAGAVRALPADIVHYKSLLPFRDALLEWLDRRP
jgi:dimethylamine monooxygenase subunit A